MQEKEQETTTSEEEYEQSFEEAAEEEDDEEKEANESSDEEDSEEEEEEEEGEEDKEEDQADYKARYEELRRGLNQTLAEREERIRKLEEDIQALRRKITTSQDILDVLGEDLDEDTKEYLQEQTEMRKALSALMRRLQEAKESTETPQERSPEEAAAQFDRVVSLKYPNWREIVAAEDFQAWRSKQPRDVQVKYYSSDPVDAVEVLDGFRRYVAEQKKRQRTRELEEQYNHRADAARSSVRKGGTRRTEQQPDKNDFDSAWDEALAQRR